MAEILVAKETFVTDHEGAPTVIHKGVTRVREGHPIATANPDLFEPVNVHFDVVEQSTSDVVEQATAAPGEARSTVRPDKAALLARADKLGLEVDKRLGVDKLRELVEAAEADA